MAYTTIDDPEAYFQTVVYTGNGSADHAITLDGDTDMQPDLVWIKNRDATDSPCLFDAVRGATKILTTDSEDAEATDADTLDSFTSDGFQVDADVKVNTNTEKYVAWCWKEAAAAGFDIVSYSGTGSARTQAHSLSAKPNFILVKKTSASGGAWFVYLTGGVPATNYMKLSESEAIAEGNLWNDVEPTSSVFSLGTSADVNGDGITYVAYVFSSIQGYSKFGSYEGNGNADGTFVYLGFKPAWLMIKEVDATSGWCQWDNKRPLQVQGFYNPNQNFLQVNETGVESNNANLAVDFLGNGFKVRNAAGDINTSGSTMIFMAFAEAPLVNSEGVPCNAR